MKGKRANYIWIGAISAVLIAAVLAIVLLVFKKDNTEVAYTYEAASDNLPEYDTDLFNIDGKLDEDIYKKLRWWEEEYSEGDMQDAVKVRATSYLGENGVYFILDVDDDNVNVDMKRASYNNSSITVYAAEEGIHTLEDNVWEIDLLPTDYINAKRYLGGYYYGTVRANGYENQPFVRSTTKGGAVNTPECKGYIMESYFPYGFLFKEGEKPENINLNFALQRSYSLEADARDVYYNFGQNVMSNWSWGDPGTWWTFHKMGLDSVDLTLDSGKGGKLEYRNDYIARYQTEKVTITPDKGYRISGLLLETKDETTNVMDLITWKDEVNTIKLRNVTDDVTLKASFEKIPTTKVTLAGRITGKGEAKDLGVRFICGGIAYVGTVAEDGSYSLEVPTGDGVIDVYSKSYGYVAKKVNVVAGSGTVTTNIKLTADDYGNKRVMSLPSEQVMGNKERVFDGTKMTGSMSKTFAYDFTLKYNGQLLEEDGTPVEDPTFGEFDNQYTSINFKGVFTDADGKPIENSDMQLQIMSWNGKGMWMVKMWLDGQYVEARLGIDELKAFGSEEGVSFRLIFANSKLSLCIVRGNNVYKLTEVKATATDERYLKTLDFYAEHCVNHSIWYVEDQTLALGRTEANSNMVANVANGDGVVSFKKSENGKLVRTSTNWDAHTFDGAFGWTGTLRVPGVLKNGKIQYHEMKTGYWVDTCKDDKDWYQFTVYIIGDGDSYYVTKNNQKTKLELNAEQIKLLGTTGLQVGAFVNGNAVSYFVDNGKGEMEVFADLYDFNENQAWYPWPNKYSGAYLIHEGSPSLGEVISTGAEFYTGLSKDMDVKGFVKNVLGDKYQSTQALNPVTKVFGPDKANYFIMNHKDIAENAFYGYNIKLDALKNTSVYINTKAWSDKYYASFVKMRVTQESAYFIWQQGVSPYLCSEAVYFLNETQIAKLTNGGLDIFIEYKDNSPEMNLYVDDGNGNLVLASTFKDSLFRKSTGITYVKNLIGYSVEVANTETDVTVKATGCVIPESGDFASGVKSLYGKNIVQGTPAADLIKIDSRQVKASSDKVNLDYYDFNIGGNWFDRFNVKLPNTVDEDGKILADATVKMTARLQGDEYYGQNLILHLEKDGIGYLEFINYGGAWESYYYRLTDKQLAQLASDEGLNLFVGHKDNENKVTLYIADGTELLPMKSFVYGKTELWAKGYSASYEGGSADSVTVMAECYKYEGGLTDVLKQAYNKAYTMSDETVLIYTDFMEASKEFDGKTEATVKAEHRKAGDPSIWQLVLKSDAVDAEGNVIKDSKTMMVMFCNDWTYQFNTTLDLNKTECILTLQEGELGEWKLHKYYLNQEQVARLASEEGLKLYVSYEDNQVTVYLEEDAYTLVNALTFTQPGIVMNDTRVRYYESEAAINAAISGYMYVNGTFIDAANTIYNHDYAIREKSTLEASRVSMHTVDSATEKVNVDYGDVTVSGTWLDHFNVKLDGAVNDKGEILKYSTTKMMGRLQGNQYFGQSVNLRLTESGAYLEMPNYGIEDNNWCTYVYQLSAEQLKQLISEDGMDIYISHVADNKITVYLADGTNLIAVKEFTYGSQELRAKGYSASYEGKEDDRVQIFAECVTYSGTIEEGLKNLYNKDYTSSTATSIYSYDYLVKETDFNKEFTTEDSSALERYTHLWDEYFYQVNVKNAGVDKDGKVLAASEMRIQYNGLDGANGYKGSAYIYLYLKEDGSYLKFTRGYAPWTSEEISLTTEQLQAIGSEKGLNIYIAHSSSDADAFVAYVQSDNRLLERFTFEIPGANHGELCKVTYSNFTEKATVSGQAYNYADTDFETAVRTVYGKDCAVYNRVAVSVEAEGAVVKGMKDVYHVGDTVSFAVEANDGYKLETVTLNGTPLTADKDGKYQFVLTEDHENACEVKVTTSVVDKTLRSFISLTGKSNTPDFGKNQFDGQNINKLMGTDGYSYLFHTKLQSTESPAAMVTYIGWGQVQEKYYVQVQSDNGVWKLYLKYYNEWHQWQDVDKVTLSEKQLAKISGNGLNLFLVNSNASTYSLYVENDDATDVTLVAEFASRVTNKQVYQVQHNATGLTTKGYFYKGYTPAEAMKKFISYTEFISLTGKSNTPDFGKNQFDGQNINKLMGTDGYSYLFHTKLQSTDSPAAMVTYVGWGQVQEKYYAQVQKDNGAWYLYLKYYNEWHQWKDVEKVALSDAQLAKIAGDGLNLLLVNSNASTYSLYVENDNGKDVTLVAEFASKVTNKQVYQVSHNVAGLTTKGYFYKNYTTAKDAAKNLLDILK